MGKPFPQEEELRTKSARLDELTAVLDIDRKAEEKRPSVLAKLKTVPTDAPRGTTRMREHVMEVR